jgi:Protein of unknown function (DUF3987)
MNLADTHPAPLGELAYYGLAGDFVRLIEPETEADPAALLLTLLVHFGNIVGRSPHYRVNGGEHRANLFVAFVGPTSSGRKGTAHRAISSQFRDTDTLWYPDKIQHGLSSGEGLIFAVRDQIWKPKVEEHDGEVKRSRFMEDAGVEDKRLLVVEEEFGSVLKMCQREGNVLSNIVRLAWDGNTLQTLTRNPLKATSPHVSIIGHTSKDDLLRYMTETENANGFGNRFLWASVKRSKLLPDGGFPDESALQPLRDRLAEATAFAAQAGRLMRDPEASEIWRANYKRLTDTRPGLFGCMVARGSAQVLRLSMNYALLDKSIYIRKEHLLAALEVWRYCEDSVRYIFGDRLGDVTADKILSGLRSAPDGLTKTGISELFDRNRNKVEIDRALSVLREFGLAETRPGQITSGGPGRSAERWFAIGLGTVSVPQPLFV